MEASAAQKKNKMFESIDSDKGNYGIATPDLKPVHLKGQNLC